MYYTRDYVIRHYRKTHTLVNQCHKSRNGILFGSFELERLTVIAREASLTNNSERWLLDEEEGSEIWISRIKFQSLSGRL